MLNRIPDDGANTHMPFLAPGTGEGGPPVLFFCRWPVEASAEAGSEPPAPGAGPPREGRIWKAFYLPPEGPPRRLETGMEADVCECSPTAWQDDRGWHVTFVAGGAAADRRFHLYRMDGPALDRLAPPVALQVTRAGFVYRDRLVWADLESLIHVRDASGDRVIELPGAFIYRVAYVSDAPDRLLVSGQWIMEQDVFTLECDLGTGHQHFVECDGAPAYKCTILGENVIYAERCGEHFEERRLRRAGTKALRPANAAVLRRPGEVAPTSTVPGQKCGCGRAAAGSAGLAATRPSCLECVEKHLGAAYVLLAETRDGYAHRLRAVGHLHEAEDESQEWPALHDAIRRARKRYQTDAAMPDWTALDGLLAAARNTP